MSLIRGLVLSTSLLVLNGCEAIWSYSNQMQIPEGISNELRVVAVRNPLSFNARQANGLETDLVRTFAKEAGYKLQWVFAKTADEAANKLKNDEADLAIGRYNLSLAEDLQVLPGPSYEESPLVMICPKMNSSLEQRSSFFQKLFGNKVRISAKVKHVLALQNDLRSLGNNWTESFQDDYPGLQFVTVENLQGSDLLKVVSRRRTACALLEENEAKYFIRFHPSLQIIQDLTEPVSIGFLISEKRPEVQKLLLNWFQKASRTREVARIKDRYTGHLQSLDEMDQIRFFRKMQTRLPQLNRYFKKYAREFRLHWQLLAAVAYQESHWNNQAVSFTGVRGIMMLTTETAEHLGVADRTHLSQSIWGGAKYLRQLIDRQPRSLNKRDRLILALATYNIGPAHMIDAQRLAASMGKNPYSWQDLKTILPLLSEKEYYVNLQYGQARGEEPIEYANRVLGFYDLLMRN